MMTIGQLASQTGVSTKTIRYYEDIGVMPEAARATNGYRTYDPSDIDRLEFIRDAQAAGLSLTEIISVLELRNRGESSCSHVIALVEQHLTDLDRQIAILERTRRRHLRLLQEAKELDPSRCTDPNRCQTIASGTTHRHSRRP